MTDRREYFRAYYAKHGEKIRARAREWSKKNKARRAAWQRNYYQRRGKWLDYLRAERAERERNGPEK